MSCIYHVSWVAFLQMQVQEECGQGIGNMMLQVFKAFRRHVRFCFWMILGLVYPTGLNSPCHCCREGYICAHSEGRIWFVSRFYSRGVGIMNAKICWVPFVLTSPQAASTHLPVWSQLRTTKQLLRCICWLSWRKSGGTYLLQGVLFVWTLFIGSQAIHHLMLATWLLWLPSNLLTRIHMFGNVWEIIGSSRWKPHIWHAKIAIARALNDVA